MSGEIHIEVGGNNAEVDTVEYFAIIEATTDAQALIATASPPQIEVLTFAQGPSGPVGPQGAGGSSEGLALAGVDIGVYTVVVLIDGFLYPADPTEEDHAGYVVGIAKQSVIAGAILRYQMLGEVQGGSFTTGARYFVGLNGQPSMVEKAVGAKWRMSIGVGKSSDTLIYRPDVLIVMGV